MFVVAVLMKTRVVLWYKPLTNCSRKFSWVGKRTVRTAEPNFSKEFAWQIKTFQPEFEPNIGKGFIIIEKQRKKVAARSITNRLSYLFQFTCNWFGNFWMKKHLTEKFSAWFQNFDMFYRRQLIRKFSRFCFLSSFRSIVSRLPLVKLKCFLTTPPGIL